jgi:ATP-dependent RNA helicase RhlE
MGFSVYQLDPRLQTALTNQKITKPTAIQAEAIPLGLEGKDVVGTARTGTGKTLAFALPLVHRLLHNPPAVTGKTRALIMAPTRELAQQITASLQMLLRGLPLRVVAVFGGVGYGPQQEALRRGVDIVVACPGRLLDHLQNRIANLSHVEVLVLDEADQMFDMGFLPPIRKIVAALPQKRQTMLFSATFAPDLQKLIKEVCHEPVKVDVATDQAAHTVTHAIFPVSQHLKLDLLLKIMEQVGGGSTLIFTRTKHRADRVAERLQKAGLNAGVLHSNRSQSQRQRTLDGFRRGTVHVLVATDIAARGIDVAGVTHVINVDIPETSTSYIHRIGRTGRAEKEGDAFTLVSPQDSGLLRDIERALGKPIERRNLEGFDYKAAPVPGSAMPSESRGRGGDRGQRPGGRSSGGSSSGFRPRSGGSSDFRPREASSGSSEFRPRERSSEFRPRERSAAPAGGNSGRWEARSPNSRPENRSDERSSGPRSNGPRSNNGPRRTFTPR